MKRAMLLVFAAILFATGCEDIQENNPAVQADINGEFFRADGATAAQNTDGSWDIFGLAANEELRIHLPSGQLRDYDLSVDTDAFATYRNSDGAIYTTGPAGQGRISLTSRCDGCGTIGGTFNFRAVISGIDTLDFTQGVFFDVPFGVDNGGSTTTGAVAANINGSGYFPTTLTATDIGNSIIISSSNATRALVIRVPSDVAAGTYSVADAGFSATITEDGVDEDATSGVIVIASHNTESNRIIGTFALESASNIVTDGQFNVVYN